MFHLAASVPNATENPMWYDTVFTNTNMKKKQTSFDKAKGKVEVSYTKSKNY